MACENNRFGDITQNFPKNALIVFAQIFSNLNIEQQNTIFLIIVQSKLKEMAEKGNIYNSGDY